MTTPTTTADAGTADEDTAVRDPSLPIAGLQVLRIENSTRVTTTQTSEGFVQLVLDDPDGHPGVHVEVDLGGAVGYWQPGGRQPRLLPPEWLPATSTSLVRSAPVGVLYDSAGKVLLGWAASEAVSELTTRCGVSEENKSFVVDVRPSRRHDTALIIALDTSGDDLARVVTRLAAWVSSHCEGQPRPAPPHTRVPVYSTWYTFTQDVDHERVTSEARLAADLGHGSVFIDDGWQRHAHGRGYQGCGDWIADEDKFPDLAVTISTIHDLGLAVGLWVAPLLLGPGSHAYDELHTLAPVWAGDQNCYILDPRHALVRAKIADTCVRLVEDYHADLLKIDFLDTAMAYHGTVGVGDIDDIGQAMAEMLRQVRQRLDDSGHAEVAFEFRQPYVSPAISRYGEVLRANDCPADSALNRSSTLDARLLSVGQIVHSDPIIWGTDATPEAIAQQLYGAWFAVPQISMRLASLDEAQRLTLRGLLQLWSEHSEVILDGNLDLGSAEAGFTQASADHPTLGRGVVARYAPVVVDVRAEPGHQVLILNATPDPRVVVRLPCPSTGGCTRSADLTRTHALPATPAGLVEFTIPAFGSATITF